MNYPLAWGKKEFVPDAFVTGLAVVSSDLKTLTIGLCVFDRSNLNPRKILNYFTVRNKPEYLVEMGESFRTRSAFDEETVQEEARPKEEKPTPKEPAPKPKELPTQKEKEDKALQTAVQVKDNKETHPAKDPKSAVKLEIRYDGKPVPVKVQGGKAFVPEPREGQNVEFVLQRDNSRERYAVVLKLNGENTIARQRLPDLQCRPWVLDAGDGPMVIEGYQIDNKEIEKFRVLSARESRERESKYGADVGTITMTVFRERKDKPKPPDLSNEAREAAVVSKGTLETKPNKDEPAKPANIDALMARLLADATRGGEGGLIAEGERRPGATITVKFTRDPLPVMSLTIVYYHPQDLPKE